jgi:hypothetical protein
MKTHHRLETIMRRHCQEGLYVGPPDKVRVHVDRAQMELEARRLHRAPRQAVSIASHIPASDRHAASQHPKGLRRIARLFARLRPWKSVFSRNHSHVDDAGHSPIESSGSRTGSLSREGGAA